MVIKGTTCRNGRRLATHLGRTDTNERAEVLELRGVAAENLRGALLEIEAVASGTRTTKPFYHASINTRADERMAPEQRAHAIDRLEAELGLTGQPRVVVLHQKEGREHCHIVWSRIDLERMRCISDSHNYRKHELVARSLEREFGHQRVQGAHIEREGKERPQRTPSHSEMLQADRTGISAKEVKEHVTDLWRRSDSAEAFTMALWRSGYCLARGDRRDYVVIDPAGGTHSLARCVEGLRTKDIRERMATLERSKIPDIAKAKKVQIARREQARAVPEPQRDPDRIQREEDEAKRQQRAEGPTDWTNRAGMVEQQRAAMDWMKSAEDHKAVRTEQKDHKREQSTAAQETKQRQALLREFGRDIENELSPSDRERTRERTRR